MTLSRKKYKSLFTTVKTKINMNLILVNDQCIYFTPLHVSSNKCSSSGGSNRVNTSSGIIHSSTVTH